MGIDWTAIDGESDGEAPNTWVDLGHVLLEETVDGEHLVVSIRSSRPRAFRLDPTEWPAHIVDEVDARLGSTDELGNLNGAQKGRVLYIVAGAAPVAALTYHYSVGTPLMILAGDTADFVDDGGYAEIEILLAALRKAADLLGAETDRFWWDTNCDHCRAIAERHGFLDRYPADGSGRRYQLELILDEN